MKGVATVFLVIEGDRFLFGLSRESCIVQSDAQLALQNRKRKEKERDDPDPVVCCEFTLRSPAFVVDPPKKETDPVAVARAILSKARGTDLGSLLPHGVVDDKIVPLDEPRVVQDTPEHKSDEQTGPRFQFRGATFRFVAVTVPRDVWDKSPLGAAPDLDLFRPEQVLAPGFLESSAERDAYRAALNVAVALEKKKREEENKKKDKAA